VSDQDGKIPARHQEFYFDPPLSKWKQAAAQNREYLSKQSFWDISSQSARAALKLPLDRPVVLSGHQPVFLHPGLWAKCLAASALAESLHGVAAHKLTDTALLPEYVHYLPEVEEDGHARRKALEFYTSADARKQAKTMPFSYLPPPDYAAFEKIFAGSRLYSPPSVKSAISGYEEKLVKGLKDSETWNDFHVQTLQLLDGMSGTQRLYLTASKIWQSAPFLDFVAAWLSRLPVLTENYNQCLDEYRHKYGITHGFSPLPNLKFEDWWFEIPFWGVNKYQQRHSLWAKNDKKYLILRTQGTGETYPVALDEFRQELAALKITIWPKALPQTLFCRLFLCDYFVHGTGGRAYEEVNDLFIEKTFKSKPPGFGTATATYWVEGDQAGKIDHIVKFEPKMEAWERSLEKNPEYLFTKQEAWKKEMPH